MLFDQVSIMNILDKVDGGLFALIFGILFLTHTDEMKTSQGGKKPFKIQV